MTKQLGQSEENTAAVVRQYGQSVERYLRFLCPLILPKLDSISRLGIDLKNSASQILSMMFAVSKDLSILRAVVLRLVGSSTMGSTLSSGTQQDGHSRSISRQSHLRTPLNSSWQIGSGVKKVNVARAANSTPSMRATVVWKSTVPLSLEILLFPAKSST